jgi:FKBP-type peptidyl-prolyl cis-trans isomerase 2
MSLWGISIGNVYAAQTADWGDVVDVEYSLYTDAEHTQANFVESNELIHIYLGTNVPAEVKNLIPDASGSYLAGFKAGIVGLRIGQEKDIKIDAEDGYSSGQLAGKDLYFEIILVDIVYDASEYETTTATSETSQVFQDFSTMMIIGGGVAILGGSALFLTVRSSRRMKTAMAEGRTSPAVRESTIKKERTQLKELRELTETYSGPEETTEKEKVKFRRRR